jgi:purine-cytosine permease-like protein
MTGFFISCLFVMWFMSKFRGWGIMIFGSLFTFMIIAALGFWVLRRQYRRAFGLDRERRVPRTVRAHYDSE